MLYTPPSKLQFIIRACWITEYENNKRTKGWSHTFLYIIQTPKSMSYLNSWIRCLKWIIANEAKSSGIPCVRISHDLQQNALNIRSYAKLWRVKLNPQWIEGWYNWRSITINCYTIYAVQYEIKVIAIYT